MHWIKWFTTWNFVCCKFSCSGPVHMDWSYWLVFPTLHVGLYGSWHLSVETCRICLILLMYFRYFCVFLRWYIFEETALCLWTGILYITCLKANISRVWYRIFLKSFLFFSEASVFLVETLWCLAKIITFKERRKGND